MDDKNIQNEAKQVPFEEQLNEAVDQNTNQFYQNILKEAEERIRSQAAQIESIQSQQIEFRDEIAVRCFVPLIDKVDSFEKAASSAYQAADAFLRARETGM